MKMKNKRWVLTVRSLELFKGLANWGGDECPRFHTDVEIVALSSLAQTFNPKGTAEFILTRNINVHCLTYGYSHNLYKQLI